MIDLFEPTEPFERRKLRNPFSRKIVARALLLAIPLAGWLYTFTLPYDRPDAFLGRLLGPTSVGVAIGAFMLMIGLFAFLGLLAVWAFEDGHDERY
jgi:hypothetical protein